MISKSPLMLLAVCLTIIFPSVATSMSNDTGTGMLIIGSPQIDDEWTESKFLQCIKQHNGLTAPNIVDNNIALECRGVYGDSTNVQARDSDQPGRCGTSLPKNFAEAADFRAVVDTVCNDLIGLFVAEKQNTFNYTFTDAYTKSAQWLYGGKASLLMSVISLSPQYQTLFEAGKLATATLNTLCSLGLTDFGTKGKGCTEELHYLRDGLLGATTTGVTNGLVDLFLTSPSDWVGSIALNWNP